MKKVSCLILVLLIFILAGCEIYGTLEVTNNRCRGIDLTIYTEGYDEFAIEILPPESVRLFYLPSGYYHFNAFEIGTSRQWVVTDVRIRRYWFYRLVIDADGPAAGLNLTTAGK